MRMREVLARQAVHANVVGGGPATKHIQISRKKVEKLYKLKSQPSPLMDGAKYLNSKKNFRIPYVNGKYPWSVSCSSTCSARFNGYISFPGAFF